MPPVGANHGEVGPVGVVVFSWRGTINRAASRSGTRGAVTFRLRPAATARVGRVTRSGPRSRRAQILWRGPRTRLGAPRGDTSATAGGKATQSSLACRRDCARRMLASWSRSRTRSRSARSRRCRCPHVPGRAASDAAASLPPGAVRALVGPRPRSVPRPGCGQPGRAASVGHQADDDEEKDARGPHCASAGGDDRNGARHQGRNTARNRPAQTPVLLATGKLHSSIGRSSQAFRTNVSAASMKYAGPDDLTAAVMSWPQTGVALYDRGGAPVTHRASRSTRSGRRS